MSKFTMTVEMPSEWGRHVRTIVITIVIVVLIALGMEVHLPFVL